MIKIRLASINDMELVFNLSNDHQVRSNAINKDLIKWQEHIVWFEERIKSDDPFYIIENSDNDFVGTVRIDKRSNENIVSIDIEQKFRSKGLGNIILQECIKKSNITEFIAYIKRDNLASSNIFLKSGFKLSEFDKYTLKI